VKTWRRDWLREVSLRCCTPGRSGGGREGVWGRAKNAGPKIRPGPQNLIHHKGTEDTKCSLRPLRPSVKSIRWFTPAVGACLQAITWTPFKEDRLQAGSYNCGQIRLLSQRSALRKPDFSSAFPPPRGGLRSLSVMAGCHATISRAHSERLSEARQTPRDSTLPESSGRDNSLW